jgi:methylenetetrahydrofolate--tRNA-(uracil-5-)-methyltransferase
MKQPRVTIIGAGLAGCEATWQLLKRKVSVRLIEMKPDQRSPAHHSPNLAELVCSNSFRSNDPHSAVGLLKREMARLGSLIMETANETAVPAGKALAVNREEFSANVTQRLTTHPGVELIRSEQTALPEPGAHPVILATGPLTSAALADSLAKFTGRSRLAFYDAIAPIVYAESLDPSIVYSKSRYQEGPGDYLNCPMDKETYQQFIAQLSAGKCVPLKEFEEVKYFEGCLPIEIMCSRGEETLRFGPMKPVGLPDPRTGKDPYAVVQLRKEDREGFTYNMVGFQTKLTYSEQQRIFRLIPGMAAAEFARLGSIHRNTFINSPELLTPTLQFRERPDVLLAGQLSGVEGYIESAAMGLLAGINAARLVHGRQGSVPPRETALGSLIHHLTEKDPRNFQPSNVNFGLFPPWEKKIRKKDRGEERARRSAAALEIWLKQEGSLLMVDKV